MKYYIFESTINDGQQANAITVKNTVEEALMVYHQVRASALANPSVSYNLAMVISENGSVYVSEHQGENTVDID